MIAGCGKNSMSRRGFTLIEVLVVVLIIAVLAAVAVPQYQKAVLKSRFSSLMPTTKAVHNGNEAYYLMHSGYARLLNELDVTATNNNDMTLELSRDPDYSYVLATRPGINNNLIMYQKHSTQFPGEIHCEALADDTKANWLCEKGMHSTKTLGEGITSGYIEYVIEGAGNGLTPAEMDAMSGPNCDKALSQGYTCSMTQNEDGSTTKRVCHARGICSIYTYNEDGSYSRATCELNSNNVCEFRAEFVYDENGNMTARLFCGTADSTTGQCTNYSGSYFIYDENGNKIAYRSCNSVDATTKKCISYSSYGQDYTYDEHGNQLTYRTCSNMNTTTGQCTRYYDNSASDYTYDENGNMLTVRSCNRVDSTTGQCTRYVGASEYTYDEDGNQLTYRYCNNVNSTTGQCTSYSGGSDYIYDENGNLIASRSCSSVNFNTGKCTSYSSYNNADYTYDENGNRTSQRYCNGVDPATGLCTNPSSSRNEYTYDENGNKTSVRYCISIDSTTGKCAQFQVGSGADYIYDSNGRRTGERWCNNVDPTTGVCLAYSGGTNYTYDDTGTVIRTDRMCSQWDATMTECLQIGCSDYSPDIQFGS